MSSAILGSGDYPVSYTHLDVYKRQHVQCDSIIMDQAEISSIPEINAKHVDAQIVHEAAIGRINDEQLIKLRTFGLSEEEAELSLIHISRQ